MKNCQILELARKQAGIADGVRVETFAAWKRAGMSVRKGEKAAFSAKINCQINGKWCMTEKAYFTADQVEPIPARRSRSRGGGGARARIVRTRGGGARAVLA